MFCKKAFFMLGICENNMDSLVFLAGYLYIGIRKNADERGNTMETIQFLCFSITTEQLTMILKMIQILGIFIPVISIAVILQKEQSKGATYLMLANAACSIVNCSYLMILEMDNAEALTTAYRMEYVGISLFFFFFILFMMEYQHMRCSRVVSIGWPCLN